MCIPTWFKVCVLRVISKIVCMKTDDNHLKTRVSPTDRIVELNSKGIENKGDISSVFSLDATNEMVLNNITSGRSGSTHPFNDESVINNLNSIHQTLKKFEKGMNTDDTEAKLKNERQMIASIMDRFFLMLFSVVIIILTSVCLTFLLHGKVYTIM